MFLPEKFYRAFLIYLFIMNNKSVQKSLQADRIFIFSAYFQKYESFGDRSAEQPMAEPCFPTLD